VVLEYQSRWVEEYSQIEGELRGLLGDAVLRIDHIGSTSVPGLGAKDIVDVQITIADLEQGEAELAPLVAKGYIKRGRFHYDEFVGMTKTDPELRKFRYREPEGARRAHLHVREHGRFNQRYALLFRDYLRASPAACMAYETVKRRAAQLFPGSIDGYLFIKDPVMDLIYEAASGWAAQVGWRP
jgi:GrpB-like predicted nucleotidyltransferase (UPF0157 family)